MDNHLTIVTDPHRAPEPLEPLEFRRVDSQLRRLSRQTMGMSGLLERRPELRGVASWSEGVVESVLWSA
jgi:hypothetical protein